MVVLGAVCRRAEAEGLPEAEATDGMQTADDGDVLTPRTRGSAIEKILLRYLHEECLTSRSTIFQLWADHSMVFEILVSDLPNDATTQLMR